MNVPAAKEKRVKPTWNQQKLNDRTLTVPERLEAARAAQAERLKAAEKILSQPKRKDTNRPRG